MSIVIFPRSLVIRNAVLLIIAFVSLTSSVIAVFNFGGIFRDTPTLTSEAERRRLIQQLEQRQAAAQYEVTKARHDGDELRNQMQRLQLELATVRAQTGKPLSTAATAKLAADLADIRSLIDSMNKHTADTDGRLAALDGRFSGLERAILPDAQKAVSVPLLQKDLASLQQQTSRDLETVRAESNRLYDLMKLLIGLMGLVSFGLLGTAVGNVFKREAKDSSAVELSKPVAPERDQTQITPNSGRS